MARAANPMFAYDKTMAEAVFEYCRKRLSLEPVPLDHPRPKEQLEAVLAGLITPQGRDPAAVLATFTGSVVTSVISVDSPRFLAFVPAAPTKASLLFDMVVSASSLQGTSWLEAAGAIMAENQALSFLADMAGMPQGAGGCFVSGGSAANLSALVVARDEGRARTGKQRVRVAVSQDVHSSVNKALHLIGAGAYVVTSQDHRLTGPALEAALEADPASDDVVAVVASAGTTNAGMVDDLAGISRVARERGLWVHVDGAYGGAALLSRSERVLHLFAGSGEADSFVVDPHKWLFAPFDCAALLYRQPALAKKVHSQQASYLDPYHTGDASEWNPSDYAYHLTRRARGLAFWYSLVVNGSDAYRDAVDAALEMAVWTADAISRQPHLELVREPSLSVVLFRRKGWGADDYWRWSARLLDDQVALATPTKWEGQTVARLIFLHPGTTQDIVREILASMAPAQGNDRS
ncbi:MAG TPA: pyridoxal-dependent decarboxylase [Acidimicrobiales bacterium]|nr:pyridoxal-dependent decarboxylase [Acidimicrobiales bacterium]